MDDVSIGGSGFPKPDTAEVATREMKETGGVNLSRAVDLSKFKTPKVEDESLYQHQWILMARYSVDEDEVRVLAETVQAKIDSDEEATPTPITVNYSPEQLLGMDGPGCAKCGVIWFAPEVGYGNLCRVSDAEVEAQRRQQQTDDG